MRTSNIFLTALVLGAALCHAAIAQPVNQIVDPNFTGTTATNTLPSITGRLVTPGSETITAETSNDGNFTGATNTAGTPAFADFNSAAGTGATITYSFTSVLGDRYVFSFEWGVFGTNIAAAQGKLGYDLEDGSTSLASRVSFAPTGDFGLLFQTTVGGSFIGDGNLVTLTFTDRTTTGNGTLLLLSIVQVVDVPEPITATLFGSALFGLAAARRRKQV